MLEKKTKLRQPSQILGMALKIFRNGKLRALVATDIAARGIDTGRISLVINLDPPNESESKVHRIGSPFQFPH